MPLFNSEIHFILTWSANFVIFSTAAANHGATFAITDAKRFASVVTLSVQNNVKLLYQSKSGLKRTISWNKHQSKAIIQAQNQYSDHLINPSF